MWTKILPLPTAPVCEDGDCEHRGNCSIHISVDEARRHSVTTPALTVLPHSPPQAWTGDTSGPCIACSRQVFAYALTKSPAAARRP